jgi:hydrogenase-4 component E
MTMTGTTGLVGLAGGTGSAGVGGGAAQLLALSAGGLLVSAVLLVWRRSLTAAVRLLAVQGVALATLVVAVALTERDVELLGVAVLVLLLKGVALPLVLGRAVATTGVDREDTPVLNPTAGLVTVAVLTTVAWLVSRPVTAALGVGEGGGPGPQAVPAGIATVLVGCLLLVTRRRVLSQVAGFVVLDNGIATVGFLTAAGVPFVVELGVSLDVLLIALILAVLSGRLHGLVGATSVDELTELRD